MALSISSKSGVKSLKSPLTARSILVNLTSSRRRARLNVCVLSYEKAKTAYKIDGKLLYAKNGGILYKSDSCIVEEVWTKSPVIAATVTEVKKADAPRVVPMGRQSVAAQPVEEDFAKSCGIHY